jgi:hypothetical protein
MIYLFYDLVCNNHHVFDIVITSSKPPTHTGIKTSYLELDDKSLARGFELDETDRKIIVKVYEPILLKKVPSRSKYITNYEVDYTPFDEIITNEAALHIPNLTRAKLFDHVTLTVDNRRTLPTIIQYLDQLTIVED